MAKRDEVWRALGRHDPGQAGNGQNIALFRATFGNDIKGFAGHLDVAFGYGQARGAFLVRDIDHMGMPLAIEMAEP
jgi:hypothetical protein